MANISLIKPVHGANLKDTTDNIDKNFSTIAAAGLWKGETGEAAMEKTIDLWSYIDDVDKFVKIDNPDIFHVIFGDGDVYDYVVDVANHNQPGEFEDFGVPMQWSLYPGNPLWVIQKPEMYSDLYKWFGESIDCSCMVTVQGKNDDGSYIYKKYDIIPKLYRDPSTGGYYWIINGVKTDIPASANPDSTIERNVRLYLIRKAGDGYQYLYSTTAAVEWVSVSELDVQPAVGDFGWLVEKKTVDGKDVMVLEVCMYDGHAWVPATVDDDNNNFFLSYDEAMLAYVWKEVYAALGDTYETLSATENHSLCFPVRDAAGEVVTDKSHKITSKTNTDSTGDDKDTSDLVIEAPADNKANVVFSGYKNIYTKPYGGDSYDESSRLLTEAEIKKLQYIDINIKDAQTLTADNAVDGALYRIDRAYWDGNDTNTKDIVYKQVNIVGSDTTYNIPCEYVRYVYLKCHNTYGSICWDVNGIGELNNPVDNPNGHGHQVNRYFEVGFNMNGYTSYDTNICDGNQNPIKYKQFGTIIWMRDPLYKNECDWDFIMHETFIITTNDPSKIKHLYDRWINGYTNSDHDTQSSYYYNYTYTHNNVIYHPFYMNKITSPVSQYNSKYIPKRKTIDTALPAKVDNARMIVFVTIENNARSLKINDIVRNNNIIDCNSVFVAFCVTSGNQENTSVCNNTITNSEFAIITDNFTDNSISNSAIILGDSMGFNTGVNIHIPCIVKSSIVSNCNFRGVFAVGIYSDGTPHAYTTETSGGHKFLKDIFINRGNNISSITIDKCDMHNIICDELMDINDMKYNYERGGSSKCNNLIVLYDVLTIDSGVSSKLHAQNIDDCSIYGGVYISYLSGAPYSSSDDTYRIGLRLNNDTSYNPLGKAIVIGTYNEELTDTTINELYTKQDTNFFTYVSLAPGGGTNKYKYKFQHRIACLGVNPNATKITPSTISLNDEYIYFYDFSSGHTKSLSDILSAQ